MKKYIRFSPTYFILTVLLLLSEVLIEKYVHDTIIRPYFGDFLVVILIYCFVRSFLRTPVIPTALAVLLFAYTIEFLQYLNLLEYLGWSKYYWARILLGNYFEWIDVAAYTMGILVVVVVERLINSKK